MLLLSAVDPPLISRWIVRAQVAGGFAPEHARWHHAAVYVGHDHVCEAVPTGVRYGPIYRYVGNHLIRVCRDHGLTQVQRYEIALRSAVRVKERYSWWHMPGIAWDATRGFWLRGSRPTRAPSVICSQVFAEAYAAATGRLLGPSGAFAAGQLTPADLSGSPALSDLRTTWLSIV